jgi:hypothetical protein
MFVAVAVMLLAVGTAQAKIWSLQDDFSTTSNPNGEWSYGHSENGFTLYTTHNSSTWSTSSNEACIWKNLGGTYLGVLPGEVALHPALHGEQSIARWTSPLDGSITVTGTFGAGDTGKVDTLIYLTSVGAPQLLFSVYDTPNSQPFNLKPLVGVGDKLDFIVGCGTDGYASDNTPLALTITPEPATLSLLALGGLTALGLRKRK